MKKEDPRPLARGAGDDGVDLTAERVEPGCPPSSEKTKAPTIVSWLHVRDRDGAEFHFSTEPTSIKTLRVELVAPRTEQTKTFGLPVRSPTGVLKRIETVPPRGKGWQLHDASAADHDASAADHTVWRRRARARGRLHEAADAMNIVYPMERQHGERWSFDRSLRWNWLMRLGRWL